MGLRKILAKMIERSLTIGVLRLRAWAGHGQTGHQDSGIEGPTRRWRGGVDARAFDRRFEKRCESLGAKPASA